MAETNMFDAIVIGSGVSAGFAAKVLAEIISYGEVGYAAAILASTGKDHAVDR